MKKLLLVLAVVAMASFLFVGCLPGGTTPDTNEYTDAGGKTYVPNETDVDVTVTFTEAVETDYIVYIARKTVDGEGVVTYVPGPPMETEPNAARTIWTVEDVDFLTDMEATECASFCLVAVVKHPCCVGEEVALKVISVDATAPDLPLFDFECGDCNACEDVCEPDGAYFTFTSVADAVDPCDADEDSCDDECSGVGTWSFKIDPDGCDECVLAVGSGCPVEGTADCGCLPWATASEGTVTYDVVFTIADNVGNETTKTYYIKVDTDEVVTDACMVVVDPT